MPEVGGRPMRVLLDSVSKALQDKNWHAALFIALAVPDIAGRITTPGAGSKKRSIEWFERYVGRKYSGTVGAEVGPNALKWVFLSGQDFYALRCAVLHEGRDDISEQSCQSALSRFHFNIPTPQSIDVHCV